MPGTLFPLKRLPELFTGRPADNLDVLCKIQEILLAHAETYYGPRKKQVFCPQILRTDYPCVRNTPDLKGGYAELHVAAADSWHIAVFQLAHETIHLLDPQPATERSTTVLEEGIATSFSLQAIGEIDASGIHVSQPYADAFFAFTQLGSQRHSIAREVRERAGHWRDTTEEILLEIASDILQELATRLATEFNRDSEVSMA